MISAKDAIRQINRFSNMPKFADIGESGCEELQRVLQKHASNDAHAERAVTAWIDEHRWLPACADLIEQLEKCAVATVKPDYRCQNCHGSAWSM